MKKHFFVFITFLSVVFFNINILASDSRHEWKQRSSDEIEYEILSDECNRITEVFTSMNALRSSGFENSIFKFLRDVGTPVSLQVLKDQINCGRISVECLNCDAIITKGELKTKNSACTEETIAGNPQQNATILEKLYTTWSEAECRALLRKNEGYKR